MIPAVSEARAQLTQPIGPDVPSEPVTSTSMPRLLPAQLTDRHVTCDELLELAAESGLASRRGAIRRLCRRSVRLAASTDGARRGVEAASLPAHLSWPEWRGAPLALRLVLDFAEIARTSGASELPATGTLFVFLSAEQPPSGLALEHSGSAQVMFDSDTRSSPHLRPDRRLVQSSGELVLPRVWAESVEALGLEGDEQAAWQDLRLRLAERQGVVPFDAGSEPRAVHRVLGWPDERSGWMPLACALLDAGLDLTGHHAATHPRAADFAERTGDWRLLLQLTADPGLGWDWGPGHERLYVWIKERDLRDRDFSRVRTIIP